MTNDKILIGNAVYEERRKYMDTDDLEKIIIIRDRSTHRLGMMLTMVALSVLSYLLVRAMYQKLDVILLIISLVGMVIVGIIGIHKLDISEDRYYRYPE